MNRSHADKRHVDVVHLTRHLAEPDDVGPHGTGLCRRPRRRLGRQIAGPVDALFAGGAERPRQLAMHMDEMLGAGGLMQRVDILGHGQNLAAMLALQPRQRPMRRIRLRLAKMPPAEIVEFMHARGVAGEALGRRHLFEIELRPQAALVAKGAEPAFGRKPGPGQNDDAAEPHLALRGLNPCRSGRGAGGSDRQARWRPSPRRWERP